MKKLVLFLLIAFNASHAQQPVWRPPAQVFQDSSTSRLHQITNPNNPDPNDAFFQSGFQPSFQGFSNAGDVETLCGRAYQNLTKVPITVTIVPGQSKDRISYLFVKQTASSQWVMMAYSQNSIPASVQIPNGAVYCPTMNENGYFYVTVLNGGRQAGSPSVYAAQYLIWTDERVPPGFHVQDPQYGCQNILAIRSLYNDGVHPYDRRYIIRPNGQAMFIRSNVLTGVCPVEPPRGGGENQ